MFGFAGSKEYSEKTAEDIDKEVKNLTLQAYDSAKKLITENRDKVEKMANALLKYETLDKKDVVLILSGRELDKPTVNALLEAEKKKEEAQGESSDVKEDFGEKDKEQSSDSTQDEKQADKNE
jgi:cell division protease FtsH